MIARNRLMRVLGRKSSINVRKVLWTCGEIGLDYRREDWGAGFASTRTAEFLALNPNGLVPVLVDGDTVLWESNTICRYLANKHQRLDLLPADPRRRALVEQWMDWQGGDFNAAWRYAFMALVRRHPDFADAAALEQSRRDWNDKIAIIENRLLGAGDYLTGDGFTLADIVVGLAVNRWLKTPGTPDGFPAVRAYHARLERRPACAAHGGFVEP
jgi:glutathione S-transferase